MAWPNNPRTSGSETAFPEFAFYQPQSSANAMPLQLQATLFNLSAPANEAPQDASAPLSPRNIIEPASTDIVPNTPQPMATPFNHQHDPRVIYPGDWAYYPCTSPRNPTRHTYQSSTLVPSHVVRPSSVAHNPYGVPAPSVVSIWDNNPSNPPSYQCRWEGCTSTHHWTRVIDLMRHIRTIHIAPNAHSCPFCEKPFGRKDHRTEHLKHCPNAG